eukprot:TRINITY_DN19179_c0_g1_i1.p1 TRINITY_DN19179_c0_g1~~TRINITY_DN19179_c0_g1_i1.p1  ORF type:complete len:602 (+),score=35.18 TRINITY_DN19179_c0_g1_i1:166-1806(+)
MSEIAPVGEANATAIIMPGTPVLKGEPAGFEVDEYEEQNVRLRAGMSAMAFCCLGGLAGIIMVISWGVKGQTDDFSCNGVCKVNTKSNKVECTNGEGCCADDTPAGATGTCTKRSQQLLILGIVLICLLVVSVLIATMWYSYMSATGRPLFKSLKKKFSSGGFGNPLNTINPTSHTITSSLALYIIKGDPKGIVTGSYLLKEGTTSWGLPVWETDDRRVLSATASGCWSIMRNGEVIAQSVEHQERMPHEIIGPMTWQTFQEGHWVPVQDLSIAEGFPVGSELEARLDDANVTPERWVDCVVVRQHLDQYSIRIKETMAFNNAEGLSGKVLEKVNSDILRRKVVYGAGSTVRTPSRVEPKFSSKNIVVRDPAGVKEVRLTVVDGVDDGMLLRSVLTRLGMPYSDGYCVTSDAASTRAVSRLHYRHVEDGCTYTLVKGLAPIPTPNRLEMSEIIEEPEIDLNEIERPADVKPTDLSNRDESESSRRGSSIIATSTTRRTIIARRPPGPPEDDRSSVATSVRREEVQSLQERIREFSKRAGTPQRQRE